MQDSDARDRELLGALQGDVPLVSTPFAVIGQMIDMSEKEVIKRAEKLRREGIVRHISAHFDLRALGYRSCLVAARVKPERIDEAAAVVNAHPGVTQNYKRNNDFNLWFTIAVAPTSKLGLERTIEVLGEEAECEVIRALPTLKLYKSSGSDGAEVHGNESEPQSDVAPLTTTEIESIRLLQRDLPLQPRPFDALARGGPIPVDELLSAARSLQKRGQIRRFGAAIQPRKTGFLATAMGVWMVPSDRADEYGAQLAQHRAVSHCYLRPTYSDWPYNIYTTVHGRSVDECESIINDLAIDTGLTEKQALYPTKEYKKVRISFFSPDADEWESVRASRQTAAAS
ncbi:MAG TPA: Lrp/AsnC family transcriptional regulator [Thermoanaerobaculia bacterium]|jgi:DNA-binding Lrp family transcriptional regulator|nr:Lrp/AsnC family transcriptional regulator [Thermoanaerobaculia bacterium]